MRRRRTALRHPRRLCPRFRLESAISISHSVWTACRLFMLSSIPQALVATPTAKLATRKSARCASPRVWPPIRNGLRMGGQEARVDCLFARPCEPRKTVGSAPAPKKQFWVGFVVRRRCRRRPAASPRRPPRPAAPRLQTHVCCCCRATCALAQRASAQTRRARRRRTPGEWSGATRPPRDASALPPLDSHSPTDWPGLRLRLHPPGGATWNA